ncbi:MAG TPA: GAF domain-containing protein [Elusimicrobiales bacterium]|nr:GAF domain-containing protein [Elusimicrobiales bacterium]
MGSEKEKSYQLLTKQLESLFDTERDMLANLSNFSAMLFNNLSEINWVGFYILKDGQLVLGPFQGKPACVRIDIGKGVCGICAQKKETIIVDDVCKFKGHIACDSASRSEIVIAIMVNGKLFGVLDADSPVKNRFNETDKKYMERFVKLLIERTDFRAVQSD